MIISSKIIISFSPNWIELTDATQYIQIRMRHLNSDTVCEQFSIYNQLRELKG